MPCRTEGFAIQQQDILARSNSSDGDHPAASHHITPATATAGPVKSKHGKKYRANLSQSIKLKMGMHAIVEVFFLQLQCSLLPVMRVWHHVTSPKPNIQSRSSTLVKLHCQKSACL